MKPLRKNLNHLTLMIFAPLLVLVGVLGFIMPEQPTSTAPAYNIFHIAFGAVGIVFVLMKSDHLIRGFNIGFGAIDLYQALASATGLFPERFFRWTAVDDVLHIVIGALLVLIGIYGHMNRQQSEGDDVQLSA
ncbi:MAG: DUF4383 domain-containing protein [Blastocatellia bacterium]|nr:DUF4383 domain-containing protein [Blastocatellia bacterium]